VVKVRLRCELFWVDVRLSLINGRWIASADTPDGPSIGLDWMPRHALRRALEPFDGVIDELLATAPPELRPHRDAGVGRT